jgi:hypothetical protein
MKKNLVIVGLLVLLVAIIALHHSNKDNQLQSSVPQSALSNKTVAVVPVEQPHVDTNHIQIRVAKISLQ